MKHHVKTLIASRPKEKRVIPAGRSYLKVSECFYDTIQGENFGGHPSVFLRLQGCCLSCQFCDTGPNFTDVWPKGNPYTIEELFELFLEADIIRRFKEGHRLIVTGGSPLLQQKALVEFFQKFGETFEFLPYVEIENEAVIRPDLLLLQYIDIWNNSPKLANSGMPREKRYKADVLDFLSRLADSWFKFVVKDAKDWDEIKADFVDTGLVKLDQIVLMPEGQTRAELQKRYAEVIQLCCDNGVRFSDRLQVTAFDCAVGV